MNNKEIKEKILRAKVDREYHLTNYWYYDKIIKEYEKFAKVRNGGKK